MGLREAGPESHESFRTLADNLPQIIWMADHTGWTYWHNRRWFEYAGTTPEASRGWGWLQRARPDYAERVTMKLRDAFAAGEAWEDTFPLRGRDDSYRWFLSRAVPVQDDDGTVLRWYGTSTDVSNQIRVVDDLREAARRKDALLAWLGHELRNPLTPILTAAHLLTMTGPSDTNLQDARDTIVRQALQLSNLVDDLLDAGRISFGKLRLRRTRVELTPLVAQAIEACQSEIEHRGHRLEASLVQQPPLHAQGLGIGLALVRSITEAHGGTVEARSEGLDQGEFMVRVPLAGSGMGT